MIASAVINFSWCKPDDPVSALAFVPGEEKKRDLTQMTGEEQAQYIIDQMGKRK